MRGNSPVYSSNYRLSLQNTSFVDTVHWHFVIFFNFSIIISNLKEYNSVFNLQRTYFTNTSFQSLYFVAWCFFVTIFFDMYLEWYLYLICRLSISTIWIDFQMKKSKNHESLSKFMRYSSDSNRCSNKKMKKSWVPFECSLYEFFLNLLYDLQIFVLILRLLWVLESRLCFLFVTNLAMKNSVNVEIRMKTMCDHAAQKINNQIDNFWLFFRCVLKAIFDVLHLTIFDDTNKSFVSSMMYF